MSNKCSNIVFRVTEEQKLLIKGNAISFHMPMSSYLRFVSQLQFHLDKEEKQDVIKTSRLILDSETYSQLLFQLKQIGNNLNQATRTLHAMKNMPNVMIESRHFEDWDDSVAEIKSTLKKLETQIENLDKKTISIK